MRVRLGEDVSGSVAASSGVNDATWISPEVRMKVWNPESDLVPIYYFRMAVLSSRRD